MWEWANECMNEGMNEWIKVEYQPVLCSCLVDSQDLVEEAWLENNEWNILLE